MLQTQNSCWRHDRRDYCQESWVLLPPSPFAVTKYLRS